MKKLFLWAVLILIFSSCETKNKSSEPFPTSSTDKPWTVYEGKIPLDEKRNLYQEVSLLSGAPGEGYYRLIETIEEDNIQTPLSELQGSYTTYYDSIPEERIIQLHNSAITTDVIRTSTSKHSRMIREENLRKRDLRLKSGLGDVLFVLNKDLEPITEEPEFNLSKRTSKLFTVEGYFIHKGFSGDFFEMNTRERWIVSKQGAYHQANRYYHELAEKKFEGLYLKAVGYSINQIDKDGKEVEALVFKKIIQMTSSPVTGD